MLHRPLTRAINPGLETADYTTIFNATNLLPSWMGGIISAVSLLLSSPLRGAGHGRCVHTGQGLCGGLLEAKHASQDPEHHQHRICIGHLPGGDVDRPEALYLTQYMINFALATFATAWYFPVLVGMYWKKATAKGMFASTVGGFAAYVILYFISGVIPSTKEW